MSTPLPGFEGFGQPDGSGQPDRSGNLDKAPRGRRAPLAPNGSPTTQGRCPSGRRELAPGAVHVSGWLTLTQQRELVAACRGWARGPAPIRHTKLPRGGVMSVQTVCIGWHWQPYAYTRTADDVNGARVAEFPYWMVELGRRALVEAYQDASAGDDYTPDTALINFYDGQAKLGMHQDKEERSSAPVVSLSIGDSCVFRFGNTETRTKPYTDIELASGDLFVFGGPSRFAYHGVPKVHPGTCDPASGLTGGRLNITMRVTGLT
ncbi:alpha-ketoglutarate-dependent dioxygenase AlkB [Streptomyces sp. NPDC050636]|uniref:alpha-ketoglutarate-dependent dioxygenase AlkB family protein n=1 Tax=Streptomyces sp. NPDC050636 TaxID=3154510 RepID=UPI00341B8117